MLQQIRIQRHRPYGMMLVTIMIAVFAAYLISQIDPAIDSRLSPIEGSQNNLPNAGLQGPEPALFDGVYNDSPEEIRQAALTFGMLPEDIARIAMNLAITQKHPRAMAALLNCGAKVDSRTVEGRTPLMIAASMPDDDAIVKQLLDAGADPNAVNNQGQTALVEAKLAGDKETMDALNAAVKARH